MHIVEVLRDLVDAMTNAEAGAVDRRLAIEDARLILNDPMLKTVMGLEQEATAGPWFFDGYSTIHSKPMVIAAHKQDNDRDDWTDEQLEAATDWVESKVASVPVRSGDTATGQGGIDASFICALVNYFRSQDN